MFPLSDTYIQGLPASLAHFGCVAPSEGHVKPIPLGKLAARNASIADDNIAQVAPKAG